MGVSQEPLDTTRRKLLTPDLSACALTPSFLSALSICWALTHFFFLTSNKKACWTRCLANHPTCLHATEWLRRVHCRASSPAPVALLILKNFSRTFTFLLVQLLRHRRYHDTQSPFRNLYQVDPLLYVSFSSTTCSEKREHSSVKVIISRRWNFSFLAYKRKSCSSSIFLV